MTGSWPYISLKIREVFCVVYDVDTWPVRDVIDLSRRWLKMSTEQIKGMFLVICIAFYPCTVFILATHKSTYIVDTFFLYKGYKHIVQVDMGGNRPALFVQADQLYHARQHRHTFIYCLGIYRPWHAKPVSSLGKHQNLRDEVRQPTEILITLANHLIYASFLHNILFGP